MKLLLILLITVSSSFAEVLRTDIESVSKGIKEYGFHTSQSESDKYVAKLVGKYSLLEGEYTVAVQDITAEDNIKKDKLAACDDLSDLLKIQDLKLDELNKLAKCRGW